MDEPCSALDPISTLAIEDLIEQLKERFTIVIVTHELDIARYAKRNIIMRDGQILSDEPVGERLDAVEEMKKIIGLQESVQLAS